MDDKYTVNGLEINISLDQNADDPTSWDKPDDRAGRG